MMDEIAVLIPCYNESKTIEKVVKDFRKALPQAVIYVYDNNSKTGRMRSRAGRAQSCAMSTSREREMLYGACSVRSTRSVIL